MKSDCHDTIPHSSYQWLQRCDLSRSRSQTSLVSPRRYRNMERTLNICGLSIKTHRKHRKTCQKIHVYIIYNTYMFQIKKTQVQKLLDLLSFFSASSRMLAPNFGGFFAGEAGDPIQLICRYSWRFRNPARKPPFGCRKPPCKIMGINYLHLNWWVPSTVGHVQPAVQLKLFLG